MSSVEDGGPPGLASHGKAVIACSVVTVGLSGIIVGLRFFARLWPARLLGYEDWCMLKAWVRRIGHVFCAGYTDIHRSPGGGVVMVENKTSRLTGFA